MDDLRDRVIQALRHSRTARQSAAVGPAPIGPAPTGPAPANDSAASDSSELLQLLMDAYDHQQRVLDRVVRISDQYQKNLIELKQQLEYASNHDALTDLPNRRHIMLHLAQAAAEANRLAAHGFGVLLADMDQFKSVNDNYGHAAGDAALRSAARAIHAAVREYDLCGRWGGEEFLIIAPVCDADCARSLAQRIVGAVAAAAVEPDTTGATGVAVAAVHGADVPPPGSLSVSIGYTVYRSGERVEQTVARADAAMYEAKERGRNRAVGA